MWKGSKESSRCAAGDKKGSREEGREWERRRGRLYRRRDEGRALLSGQLSPVEEVMLVTVLRYTGW